MPPFDKLRDHRLARAVALFFSFEEKGRLLETFYRVERGRGVRGVKRSGRQAEVVTLPAPSAPAISPAVYINFFTSSCDQHVPEQDSGGFAGKEVYVKATVTGTGGCGCPAGRCARAGILSIQVIVPDPGLPYPDYGVTGEDT